jgi:UDP-2-acetamido-3-amino-2,3-dideoxy-glucuronate N-acetyltransferase
MNGLEYVTNIDKVTVGTTTINRFSHVLATAQVGTDVMIGEHCYIAGIIGNGCKIQNGNNIWEGVELGNDVFIGPNCHLTNDHNPSQRFTRKEFIPDKTIIGDRATIGSGVSIVAPCKIGADAMIGAGSTILRDIEPGEKVNGVVK